MTALSGATPTRVDPSRTVFESKGLKTLYHINGFDLIVETILGCFQLSNAVDRLISSASWSHLAYVRQHLAERRLLRLAVWTHEISPVPGSNHTRSLLFFNCSLTRRNAARLSAT